MTRVNRVAMTRDDFGHASLRALPSAKGAGVDVAPNQTPKAIEAERFVP